VILDGFDLGAGILHLLVGKTEEERVSVIRSIGPVWDGNEVWLIAAGGTLACAFPKVYASSFSGFYLPLMIVLWLLMLRALGLELRHQIHHPLWTAFWDAAFSLSSLLLTIFFGAALGNVVRGVPLDADGYFFAPLWTRFTVLMGLVALATLTMHGAHYLAMKTAGVVHDRALVFARRTWAATAVGSLGAMASTFVIHPELWENYALHPAGILLPLAAGGGLVWARVAQSRGRDTAAFLSSAVFIAGMLASTAFGLFPRMLPSTTDPARSLTAYHSAAGAYGLGIGVIWWGIGMALAAGYTFYMYRSFRGKVAAGADHHGY
jgi:cytochrome d ubiquinol oxidase subunit II